MSEVVADAKMINDVIREIDRLVQDSRVKMDDIINRNEEQMSYEELIKTKDLAKLYGNCADDYSKLSFLQTGVNEALMDLRSVRRNLNQSSTIPPSILKTYRMRIDNQIEDLQIFNEAIQSSKQGMEARVRFFNSCAYRSIDRAMGVKC